jgi:hypothetical protein
MAKYRSILGSVILSLAQVAVLRARGEAELHLQQHRRAALPIVAHSGIFANSRALHLVFAIFGLLRENATSCHHGLLVADVILGQLLTRGMGRRATGYRWEGTAFTRP